ncbi:MAG TPA: BamA/TamA family outer membrane protein [Thermoanaerobaculia bacterium]|nr:BamA/TamA family outer membrane protein [Thermoanaerobaculia bacterium]
MSISKNRRTIPTALLASCAVVLGALAAPPAAEAQFFGYFGKNKVTYETFDWQVYHSPHFDVYFYEAERDLLPKIVSFAESAYDRISRRLDFQINEPTALIVYATHSAFQQNNIIQGFVPEGVGAFATDVRYRMVMPADLPDPELFQLVMHELTHIFEYHILFQGSIGRAIAQRPPTWVMEGFASYMADDEGAWEKMWLRDAVVNDNIPPISRVDFQGFMAYRFGHAVFDFIEERWGEDGIQDFIYELRNTIGARADRAIERAFRIEPEEFDTHFRRWLRQRYLPELVASGEPLDFGRPFRVERRPGAWETSPAVSPSGDLVAAFTTMAGEVDVALFDARRRRFIRNLTPGFTNQYETLIGQGMTTKRVMGRDLAFSPDGDLVAVFAKREGGRSLVLLDVLKGGIHRRIDMDRMGLEQQLSPAFSPDGRKVAFSAWRDGDFDVFTYDLESGELVNLTNDDLYNGSPAYAPDGSSLVFTSVVGGYQKLFALDLATGARRQVSFGESHEHDAIYSPDGARLYFTSDRLGAANIYSVDLENGEVTQHTNAVTGCFMPGTYVDQDGRQQIVYTGFWRQAYTLYRADPEEAFRVADGAAGEPAEPGAPAQAAGTVEPAQAGEPGEVPAPAEPAPPTAPVPFVRLGAAAEDVEALPRFEPDIEVSIDPANEEAYRGFRLFLEDADTLVAVDDDGTVLGAILLRFSDQIGDRQLLAFFQSVYRFTNFDVLFTDSSRRLTWMLRLFDDRSYFVRLTRESDLLRDALYAESGLMGYVAYPFDLYRRVEVGLGYKYRDIPEPLFSRRRLPDGGLGEPVLIYDAQTEGFPVVEAALVEDTVRFAEYGPVAGRRWRLGGSYAPDLEDSGTLSRDLYLDARQYVPLTRRSNLAFRVWGAQSEGNFTRPFFFGGLDQLRGVEIFSLVGDHAFYGNAELRFPLIDVLATPVVAIRNVRGAVFFDIGGAYFEEDKDNWKFYDSDEDRLIDGFSSYGFGVSAFLFGLPVNWSFAKRWDLKDTFNDFETSFWIGTTF